MLAGANDGYPPGVVGELLPKDNHLNLDSVEKPSGSSSLSSEIEGASHGGVLTAFPVQASMELVGRLMAAKTDEEMASIATAFAQSGDREKTLELLAAIESVEDSEKRDLLSRSLQALHNAESGLDLLGFLTRNVKDQLLADQACDALARNIAPADISILDEGLSADPEHDPLLRSYLVQTIGRIRSVDAVEALTDLCWKTQHKDAHAAAAQALGAIGTSQAISALIRLIEHFQLEDLDSPLVQSLMNSSSKDARLILESESARSPNQVIRYATAHALARLSGEESVYTNVFPGP